MNLLLKFFGCFLYNKVTKLKTNHNEKRYLFLLMVLFPI